MTDESRDTLSLGDRLIEIIAVLLLGMTTIGTAWCGYQAAQWNGQSGDLARMASLQSLEGARQFGLATQKVSYDSQIVAQYAQARADGNTRLQQFYRESLIRPDFLPILDRWEATVSAGQSPLRLTEDPEYLAAQLAEYEKAVAAAEDSANASNQAADTADDYVAITILLASSLFFAGVTSSFRYRPARAFLLILSLGTFAIATARLADLPVL